MPISTTTVTVDQHTQAGGGRYVIERHTDTTGGEHRYMYLAPNGFDTAARAAARAEELNVSLAEAEAEAVLEGG